MANYHSNETGLNRFRNIPFADIETHQVNSAFETDWYAVINQTGDLSIKLDILSIKQGTHQFLYRGVI